MTLTYVDRLTLQDARISVCPGCADWCWDRHCVRCDGVAK